MDKSRICCCKCHYRFSCHHLRATGEPGEYDLVIGCVQQRGSWNPILHMQQYFPITEIMLALQQVAWRRQQRHVDQVKAGGKEFKRSGFWLKQGHRAEMTKESYKANVDGQNLFDPNALVAGSGERRGTRRDGKSGIEVRTSDDKPLNAKYLGDASLKSQEDSLMKSSDGTNRPCTEHPAEGFKDERTTHSKGNSNLIVEKSSDSIQNQGVERVSQFVLKLSVLRSYLMERRSMLLKD